MILGPNGKIRLVVDEAALADVKEFLISLADNLKVALDADQASGVDRMETHAAAAHVEFMLRELTK